MLWIDRNAEIVGQAVATCSKMRTPSRRRKPPPPRGPKAAAAGVLLAVDRCHAQLGRRAQHVGGEVLFGVPFQCVWRDALLGELGRRLGDHAFVVVETEVIHVGVLRLTSWWGWRTRRHP